MALVILDRVKETCLTTGTGAVTLQGAVSGYQSFSVIGNGNTTYYAIVSRVAAEWEVGVGTYTSATSTLSRDTVLSSSNGGSLVSFTAGTKDVLCTYPAERAVALSSDGTSLPVNGNISLSGYGRRFYAPMGESTLTNQFAFQSSTSGGNALLYVLPNVLGGTAGFVGLSNPDLSGPASTVNLQVNAAQGDARLNAGASNGGTFLPLAFRTNGTERMRISTAGNVGIGATPNDPAGYKFLEIYGDVANGGGLRTFTSTGGVDLRVQATGSLGYVGTYTNTPVVFVQNNTERFRLDGTYINISNQNYTQNKTDGTSPTMDITSITASGYAPPIFALNRWGASSTATPSGSAVGQIRFNGLDTSNGYANFGTIGVDIGTNAVGGAPADMVFYASSSGAAATERMRIAGTNGVVYIGGNTSTASVRVNEVASSTRWIELYGSNGGNPKLSTSSGSNLEITSGNSGNIVFTDGAGVSGGTNFSITYPGAACKNWMSVQGAGSGGGIPAFLADSDGTDPNVSMQFISKGTGSVYFATNRASPVYHLQILHTASTTRRLLVTGAASTGNPRIQGTTNGSDTTNIVIGSGAAMGVGDTDGYMMIPSCPGQPTGTPANNGAGRIAMQYDTLNNKIWFYNGSWRSVAVA